MPLKSWRIKNPRVVRDALEGKTLFFVLSDIADIWYSSSYILERLLTCKNHCHFRGLMVILVGEEVPSMRLMDLCTWGLVADKTLSF